MLPEHARILVADDDAELLGGVADALTDLGAHVVCAASGEQLVQQLADHGPFNLVITDVSMPWMSGLQAMHSARRIGLATPIIVMTGLQDARIPAQVAALGVNAALLRKPFELDELEATALRLLGSPNP